jgi:hypothetical protein
MKDIPTPVTKLVNETIELCAKVCEAVYESKCDTWPDALSGVEDCIRAIRALKEEKK